MVRTERDCHFDRCEARVEMYPCPLPKGKAKKGLDLGVSGAACVIGNPAGWGACSDFIGIFGGRKRGV